MFLEIDPTLCLGVHRDTRFILMHPFFKAVNWEVVLEKHIKPPVKPVKSEFVIVHQEAPGDIDESGSEISLKTAYEEPELEGAANKPQIVECVTLDPDESDVSNQSASEGPVLEGPS
jgi:hypothetical protein